MKNLCNNKKENKNLCFNCKFHATKDYGYSNYTVLGTDDFCLKQCNPFMQYASFLSVLLALIGQGWHLEKDVVSDFIKMCEYASNCKKYVQDVNNNALRLDVDGLIKIEDCGDIDIILAWYNMKYDLLIGENKND